MQAPANPATSAGGSPATAVRDAFRDLHATRLHAFALLITLGDGRAAARLATDALAAGAANAADLRHPERAAAWLRMRVVRKAGDRHRSTELEASARLDTLSELDVDQLTLAGLAALRPRERAALVATMVERLDLRDVATIVGRNGAQLDAMLRRARRAYAARHAEESAGAEPPPGPIIDRIRDVAARAMA